MRVNDQGTFCFELSIDDKVIRNTKSMRLAGVLNLIVSSFSTASTKDTVQYFDKMLIIVFA